MGVPYEVVDLAFVLGAVGLLACWRQAAPIAQRLQAVSTGANGVSRVQTVRRAGVAGLILLATVFIGLLALGAPLGRDEPLVIGGSGGGDDPALLAITDLTGGQSEFEYAYQPGGEIRTAISLANNDNVPLTVTGLHQPAQTVFVHAYKLFLPPGPLTADPPLLYPSQGLTWASEPFHPFEIPARSEVAIGFGVDLNVCSILRPVATLAPSASPADHGLNFVSGFGAADTIEIDYTAFGVSRTAQLRLMTPMTVVTSISGPPADAGCSAPSQ